mmetsp:Transcript_42281/g.76638  ORF Transcript_42281/g.76638 Transcript_42281/m.76638 type:complete len:243 (-) Transcript_42281:71-799(-)
MLSLFTLLVGGFHLVASTQVHALVAQGGHNKPALLRQPPNIARGSSPDGHQVPFLLIPHLAPLPGAATESPQGAQRQVSWQQENTRLPLTHAGALETPPNASHIALPSSERSESLMPRTAALHGDQHGRIPDPNATATHPTVHGHHEAPLVRGFLHRVSPYPNQNDPPRHEDDIWRTKSKRPQAEGPLGLPKLVLALVADLVAMIIYVALIPIVLNLAKKPDTIMNPIRYCVDRLLRCCSGP